MAKLGKLNIVLGANTAEFQKKFKKANKTIGHFTRNVIGLKGGLAGLGGLMAGAFGAHSLISGVQRAAAAMDKMAKFSARVGANVEQFSALVYAGERAGVTAEALSMGLQRMVRRMSEASHGMGEARNAVQELGIDARALSNMRADEAFMRVLEALEGVTNQSDRVRLAMKLFDSEGVALVQMLEQGGIPGLKALVAEAKALGKAVTEKEAKAAERYADQLTRLAAVWDAFMQKFVSGIVKVMDYASWWDTKNTAKFGLPQVTRSVDDWFWDRGNTPGRRRALGTRHHARATTRSPSAGGTLSGPAFMSAFRGIVEHFRNIYRGFSMAEAGAMAPGSRGLYEWRVRQQGQADQKRVLEDIRAQERRAVMELVKQNQKLEEINEAIAYLRKYD